MANMPNQPDDTSRSDDQTSPDASWNAPSLDCPSWKQLEAFAAGTEDASTRKHVTKCPRCSALITEIRSNSGIAELLGVVVAKTGLQDFGQKQRPTLDVAPDLIPGYTLIEEIHRGGQGIVYKALQDGTKRAVAVKMLLAGVFSTDKQRQRFELEAEIAANLRHPCIATVYEVVPMRHGRYAIAMEYVDGVRIDQHEFAGVSAKSRFDACLRLFCDICDAVTAAHRAGVIHRDIKPSNILVDKANKPRLLDFGIARRESGSEVTMTGDSAWTLGYASPEQISDPRAVDIRSDVYSLGVVLYELLSDKAPYDLTNLPLSKAVERIQLATPAPLVLRNEFGGTAAARDLVAVVMHALEKQPEHRYQSVESFAADLRRLSEGRAVTAPTLGKWYRLRKAAVKHWKPLLATSLFLVAISAGVIAWTMQRAKAQVATSRAVQERANTEGVRILTFQVLGPTQVSLTDSPRTQQRQVVDSLALRLEMGELRARPNTEASLRSMLAGIYYSHGLYPQAEHLQREALRSLDRAQKETPVDPSLHRAAVNRTNIELARTLLAQGLSVKAREMCESISKDHEVALEDRLEATAIVGRTFLFENDIFNAEKRVQSAKELWNDLGSPQELQPTVLELESRISLANGDKDQSHALADRAMLARIRTTFDEDPRTLETMRLLAETVNVDDPNARRMPPAVIGKLNEGKKLGTDSTARGYWDLARAQVTDESKGRWVEYYDDALLRTGMVSACLLARDKMYIKARHKAVWTWDHLCNQPIEDVDSKLAIALLCKEWSLCEGDTFEADIWAGHALSLVRKRSTPKDPDCRLSAITFAAAECAAGTGDYTRARRLLEEAKTAEFEHESRIGTITTACKALIAILDYVEHATPLPQDETTSILSDANFKDLNELVRLITRHLHDAPGGANVDSSSDRRSTLNDADATLVAQNAQTIATSMLYQQFMRKSIPPLRKLGHEALASQLEGVLRRVETPIAIEKTWVTPAPAQ